MSNDSPRPCRGSLVPRLFHKEPGYEATAGVLPGHSGMQQRQHYTQNAIALGLHNHVDPFYVDSPRPCRGPARPFMDAAKER